MSEARIPQLRAAVTGRVIVPEDADHPPEDDSYHPTAVARTMFTDAVDRAAAETIVDRIAASDASLRVVQLRATHLRR